MNYQITEEQTMILGSLKAFMEKEIYPYEAETDRAGKVPEELGNQIKERSIETGFFACNLPESVGGGGLDYTTLGLIERELGKVSYGLGAFIARPTELLLACEGDQIERGGLAKPFSPLGHRLDPTKSPTDRGLMLLKAKYLFRIWKRFCGFINRF